MPRAYPAKTLGSPKVISSKTLDPAEARFVEVKELTYRASNGTERKWEATNRKTRAKDGIADAVDIFTRISHPSIPESTIIVLQFRPPINAISIEFPAGLIDQGESPEQAALRELAEETGYGSSSFTGPKGTITHVSKVLADSPGMSTETTVLVCVKFEFDGSSDTLPEPQQRLDEGEFIEKRVVPIQDLYDTLLIYQELGYVVDTRLHHIAYGIQVDIKKDQT